MQNKLEELARLPLHRHLGIENIRSDNGEGALEFDAGEALINATGVLHGGVIYMVLDICAYAGMFSVLPPDRVAVTHDIHVSVMRPVMMGDRVRVTSKTLKMGRTLCFLEAFAHVNDRIVAKGTVTKSLIEKKLA